MKTNLLIACTALALTLPAVVSAQDSNPAPQRPDAQALREQLRDLPPEERQARLRELREQYGAPEGGPGQRRPGGPQAGMMAGRMGGGIENINAVLTPEQRESIRSLMTDNREKAAGIEEKLRVARKAMLEAAIEKNFNEEALRQKIDVVSKLEADLTVLRVKAFSKVEPPLSAEQIERIKNPPAGGGQMLRQRGGPGPDGNRPPQGEFRPGPRPPAGEPRDENDLPPPMKP